MVSWLGVGAARSLASAPRRVPHARTSPRDAAAGRGSIPRPHVHDLGPRGRVRAHPARDPLLRGRGPARAAPRRPVAHLRRARAHAHQADPARQAPGPVAGARSARLLDLHDSAGDGDQAPARALPSRSLELRRRASSRSAARGHRRGAGRDRRLREAMPGLAGRQEGSRPRHVRAGRPARGRRAPVRGARVDVVAQTSISAVGAYSPPGATGAARPTARSEAPASPRARRAVPGARAASRGSGRRPLRRGSRDRRAAPRASSPLGGKRPQAAWGMPAIRRAAPRARAPWGEAAAGRFGGARAPPPRRRARRRASRELRARARCARSALRSCRVARRRMRPSRRTRGRARAAARLLPWRHHRYHRRLGRWIRGVYPDAAGMPAC